MYIYVYTERERIELIRVIIELMTINIALPQFEYDDVKNDL